MDISVVEVEIVKPRNTSAVANFELVSYILWDAVTNVNEF